MKPDDMPTAEELLDPVFAEVIGLLPFADIGPDNLSMLRVPFPAGELSDAVVRTEHRVPGSRATGEPEIPIRVHQPVGASDVLACVYAIHGGGYVLGSYDMEDELFDRWCPALGLVGVSVEYRLAPEHSYPAPLEDCYRGLVWTFEHAEELGIDPDRIGVRGISAGGGLAAALALLARDRGGPPIAFQILDCPMIDDRQQTPSSQLGGLAVWSRASNTFGWQSYLGERYGSDDVPYTAAPARATDLTGLPPAFVSVGTVDGFRDEDILYAMRLNQAGVPTELHVYPGAPHGYHMLRDAAVTRQSHRDVAEWLARQIAPVASG